MKSRTFIKILAVVMVVGLIVTVGHVIYIANAYEHCSIIQFISGEIW